MSKAHNLLLNITLACAVVTFIWLESPALAATVRPAVISGLMQQPTSQYYHFTYGAQMDVARKEDAAIVRWQYLERPAFRRVGYVDQDFSGAMFFGTNVLKSGQFGVNALVGGGYAWGYLKEEGVASPKREGYKLPGMATALEARWTTSLVDVRLAHQVLICQNSKAQLQAYVAWPFTWVLLSLSTPINIGG
jgi:hypothetical protein